MFLIISICSLIGFYGFCLIFISKQKAPYVKLKDKEDFYEIKNR